MVVVGAIVVVAAVELVEEVAGNFFSTAVVGIVFEFVDTVVFLFVDFNIVVVFVSVRVVITDPAVVSALGLVVVFPFVFASSEFVVFNIVVVVVFVSVELVGIVVASVSMSIIVV